MESPVRLATPLEVAEFLGSTVAGIAQMRHRGNGPDFVRTGSRKVMYRWEDVIGWVERQRYCRTDRPSAVVKTH